MWILPKQLHTSAFVPDTAALNLDSNESSQICAQSLFVRSKPSPARTWSQKWKRDSWSQHLFGRILKDSLGTHFVTAWTSSLVATLASPSAQPVNDSELTTQDTSGPSSQMEFGFSDPSSASSRTSKDISASDSEKSSKNWEASVTKQRGEYSQRVKSARLTSVSGFSSWPTAAARDYKGESGAGRQERKGNPADTLPNAVAQWPTPSCGECLDQGTNWETLARLDKGGRILRRIATMEMSGPADPINSSTHGSRPGSQKEWRTPTAAEEKNQSTSKQIYLQNQVGATPQASDHVEGARTALNSNQKCLGRDMKQWATPTMPVGGRTCRSGKRKGELLLDGQAKQWATPRLGGEEKAETRLARGKDIGLHGQAGAMTNSAKLNPRWVETLMGLPVGWTMPSCIRPLTIAPTNSACSATESCQQQQNELFEF